jgi:hypothetical protein
MPRLILMYYMFFDALDPPLWSFVRNKRIISLSRARALSLSLSLSLSKQKDNLDIAFDSPVLPVSDHACYQLSDKSDAEGEGAWSGERQRD